MPIATDTTVESLSTALSVYQRRHQVLASNIANVETPGYRAKEVDFERALRDAFANKDGQAASADPPEPAAVIDDVNAPERADGNTVDMDIQMAKLAANSERYNTLARLLGKHFTLLREAIDGVH